MCMYVYIYIYIIERERYICTKLICLTVRVAGVDGATEGPAKGAATCM